MITTPFRVAVAALGLAAAPLAAGAVGFPTDPFAADPLILAAEFDEAPIDGPLGTTGNTTRMIDLGGPGLITGLGFDFEVNLIAEKSSAPDQIGIAIEGGPTPFTIFPAIFEPTDFDFFGFDVDLGPIDLSDLGVDDIFVPGGLFAVTLFELFDDVEGPDSLLSGELTVLFQPAVVPLPAGLPLLLAGLGGLALLRRRR